MNRTFILLMICVGMLIVPTRMKAEGRDVKVLQLNLWHGLSQVPGGYEGFIEMLDTIDAVAFSDLMSNAAVTSGSALGIFLDRRFLEYDERSGSVAKKAVRYIAGIAVVVALAIMVSLIPLPHYAASSLLFFMAGASVTFIYPAIALKAGLFR